jgi:hypothetical protein
MGAGAAATAGASLRPLLYASAVVAVLALLYVLTLSLIVAAALSRLSVVHNSAAEYSERVYFALPFVFSRRRGAVPGSAVRNAANARRHTSFDEAYPETRQLRAAGPGSQCAVCIDALRVGDRKRRLGCKHEFHTTCIDLWIDKGANRCPLCNMRVMPFASAHARSH